MSYIEYDGWKIHGENSEIPSYTESVYYGFSDLSRGVVGITGFNLSERQPFVEISNVTGIVFNYLGEIINPGIFQSIHYREGKLESGDAAFFDPIWNFNESNVISGWSHGTIRLDVENFSILRDDVILHETLHALGLYHTKDTGRGHGSEMRWEARQAAGPSGSQPATPGAPVGTQPPGIAFV